MTKKRKQEDGPEKPSGLDAVRKEERSATVLLVDDHPVFRKGLRLLIEEEPDLAVIGEAGDGEEALALVERASPDVVIMDITMPNLDGIGATQRIVSAHPKTRIIALSIHSGKRFVEDMLRAGARGYVLKESAPEDLVRGIRAVLQGEVYLSPAITTVLMSAVINPLEQAREAEERARLTPSERALLQDLAEGQDTAGIAAARGKSEKSVQSSRRQLMSKLGVTDVAGLVEYARARQWFAGDAVDLEGPAPQVLDPILETKLHPPSLTSDLVARPHLLEQLETNVRRPLTLVSAAAGYGKSTVVAQWLESSAAPGAWLSLDEGENDLRSFVRYLVSAVRRHAPKSCKTTWALLETPELPSPTALADYLANDMEAMQDSFILVLDDYHCISDMAIHDLVTQLLNHPPRPLHLAILSRRDPPLPVALLRAGGGVVEIREKDLEFSQQETEAILMHVAQVTVTPASLLHLVAEVEGWITGLRLVCLALRHQEDPDAYLAEIHGGTAQMQEYLVEQVLSRQPEELQAWLLRTAILDRFCAPLCDAVCGGRGEGEAGSIPVTGERFMHTLGQANLFSIRLDPRGDWVRYHHLFQQLLQRKLESRMSTAGIAALHQKASAWFEGQGLIDEAIAHALAGGNTEHGVTVVERNLREELDADRWFVVEKWLSLLPADVAQQRPALLLARAWVAYYRYHIEQIPSLVAQAEPMLSSASADPVSLAELNFFRSVICYWDGNGKESKRCADEAAELMTRQHGIVAGEVGVYRALAGSMIGKGEAAVASLEQDIRTADPAAYAFLTRLLAAEAFVHLLSADAAPALHAAGRLVTTAQRWPSAYAEAWGHYSQALAHFHTRHLDPSAQGFLAAIERRAFLENRAVVDAYCGLLLTRHFMKQPEVAAATAEELKAYARELNEPDYVVLADSGAARLALLQGDLDTAAAWVRRAGVEPDVPGMFFWLEDPTITRARIRIAEGTPAGLQEAVESLESLRPRVEKLHMTCQAIDILVLLSAALEKVEGTDRAIEVLEEAVAQAHPGGWIRPFVEVGPPMDRLLGQLPADHDRAGFIGETLSALRDEGNRPQVSAPIQETGQTLIEPLTNRELDILDLLAERLYDKEIADRLSIGPGTVKSHLKHIYGKLGVGNRRQAVIKAEELGLLG